MPEKQAVILVVDDDRGTRHLLEGFLKPLGFDIKCASNGEDALKFVRETPPDIILLDAIMPVKNGFQTVSELKADPKTVSIPVVMITALEKTEDRIRALEAGSNDILTKPVAKAELLIRVKSLLESKAYQDLLKNQHRLLEEEVSRRTQQLKTASLEAIFRLTKAAEYKDQDTGAHIQRMSRYGYMLATKLKMDQIWLETFLYATSMHDVGKIGIPDKILLKPGKLNEYEWDLMQQHTIIGSRILENSHSPIIKMGERIALSHHERWDGTGYPNHLKKEEIPIEGRISAIADVYDALTSKRPYKEPFSMDKSLKIMEEERGKAFDPKLLDMFLEKMEDIISISDQYADNGTSLFFQMNNAAQTN